MANLSYAGPLPLPTVVTHSCLTFPSAGIPVRAPAGSAGAGTIYILDPILPAGTVGTAYSQTLTVGGGTVPYTLSVSSGSLPAGLSLAGTVISGTPTAAGSSSFTLRAVDAASNAGTQAFTLAVGTGGSTGGGNSGFVS